jgi:deazaflavin-dependent oxidoreductase (nitroreductase family)
MPLDKTTPTQQATTTHSGFRFSIPRGLIVGTVAGLAIVWIPFEAIPHSSLLSCEIQTGVYLALLILTACSRRAKVLFIRTLQRYLINPLFRLLLVLRLNPYGLVLLETRGHRTGKTRQVPVGNGRKGSDFWIIAEHGTRAGWVRNIQHDPNVRIRLRRGLRYHWVNGTATIRPDEDALARQRKIIAWHPLRALNAVNVRVFGADLLAVHVQLHTGQAGRPGSAPATWPRTLPTSTPRQPGTPHDSLAAVSW